MYRTHRRYRFTEDTVIPKIEGYTEPKGLGEKIAVAVLTCPFATGIACGINTIAAKNIKFRERKQQHLGVTKQ
jgi:hypothetical protein